MTSPRSLLALLLILLFPLVSPTHAMASDATPSPINAGSLDLAAIALTPADVPPGFFDEYSEWWVPPGAIDGIIGDAPPPAGLAGAYQSFFTSTDSPRTINTFLLQFESPAAAEAGRAVVDAGLRPPLPEGTTTEPSHDSGPPIGNGSSTITSVDYDTREAGGPFVSVVANSFVHDAIVGVVSIEYYVDPPAEGSPVPAGTPVGLDRASQADLASQLAGLLDARIGTALTGGELSDIDPVLSERIVPLQQLVSADTPVFGGYKAGPDLLECRSCGEENTLGAFADAALDGFARGIVAGPEVDGEPMPPYIAVGLNRFASPADAAAVLDAIRSAPNELPTPYPVPRGERTAAPDPAIPGVDAAAAYTGILNPDDPAATPDSAGVVFVVGDTLATIDVQGGLTAEEAMAIAVDLAGQQAGCLASTAPCASVSIDLPPID